MQREVFLRCLLLFYYYSYDNSVLFKIEQMTIKATPNYSKRTFTIREYYDGKLFAKYRTIQLRKEEFLVELNNTENDWRQFLKSSDYYLIRFYN